MPSTVSNTRAFTSVRPSPLPEFRTRTSPTPQKPWPGSGHLTWPAHALATPGMPFRHAAAYSAHCREWSHRAGGSLMAGSHSAWYFEGSPSRYHLSVLQSFSRPTSAPCTGASWRSYPLAVQLTGICAVSTLGPYDQRNCGRAWTSVRVDKRFSSLLGEYRSEISTWGTARPFSKTAASCYNPTSTVRLFKKFLNIKRIQISQTSILRVILVSKQKSPIFIDLRLSSVTKQKPVFFIIGKHRRRHM